MDTKEPLVWFRGSIIPVGEAKITVLSPSVQYGLNVFEGVRAYWSEVAGCLYAFRLQDHINRLYQSATILRLKIPYTPAQILNAVTDVVAENRFTEDISLRIVILLDKPGSWSTQALCEMLISPVRKGRECSDETLGLTCGISSWLRINGRSMSPRVKTGANYLNSRMAFLEASAGGYDAALFLNDLGTVAEGTGSTLFMVREGRLVTPPLDASILESITRDSILEIARHIDIDVSERHIDRTELYIADELFLCGTSIEVCPISSVDRIIIGSGRRGPITKALIDKFFSVVRAEVDDYSEWRTVL